MGFGYKLKDVLREKKMTVKELSKITGISLNTLYSITKRDTSIPNDEIIQKISSALNIQESDLLDYSNQVKLTRNSLGLAKNWADKSIIPGNKVIDINVENMKQYPECFEILQNSVLEMAFAPDAIAHYEFDSSTGERLDADTLKNRIINLSDSDKVALYNEVVESMELNTILNSVTIIFKLK